MHCTRRRPLVRLVRLALVLVLLGLTAAAAWPVEAATVPEGFVATQVAAGMSTPTAFAFSPDGRIFVSEQGGSVRVVKGKTLLATPFTTITVDSEKERGLLGIALHPDFPTTPYLYVYYTVPGNPVHNRISRFTADGDVAKANSEEILVDLANLSSDPVHNGGGIHFGADGKLYAGVGENGNPDNAETLTNPLGKILRYNDDGSIPSDNPFYDGAGPNADAIWAYGLRNPYTFAFQRGTGRMFINDVGQGAWEEINDGIAGSNYGWNTCEGMCNPPNANFRDPLFAYPHGLNSSVGCAITGGAFYNPTVQQFPDDFTGDYFFADVCRGWIHRYDIATDTALEFATDVTHPVDLYVDTDGALYYLTLRTGQIWRITYQEPATETPTATATFTPTTTLTPSSTATFTTTRMPSSTAQFTSTPSQTPTRSRTLTATVTSTLTQTPTRSRTFTATVTMTQSPTVNALSTVTATPTSCEVLKPVLKKPAVDAVVNKRHVRLDWADDACADFYRVRLQKMDGSGRQFVNVVLSKYRTRALAPGELYQFRVIACSAAGCERSKWSPFMVAPSAAP